MDKSSKPFLVHLDELRKVVFKSLAVLLLFLLPAIFIAPYAVDAMIAYAYPAGMKLSYFRPLEPFFVQLKVAFIIALACGIPFIGYFFGRFIAPGLYLHERKAFFGGVMSAFFLFIFGACFALFLLVPMLVNFSLSFASDGLKPELGLAYLFDLSTTLVLGFGLVFEVPILLLILIRCGILSVATLRRQRPFIIIIILVLAAVMTPPDVISQILMAVPTYLLFEATLLIGGCFERERKDAVPEDVEGSEDKAQGDYPGKGEAFDLFYGEAKKVKRRKIHSLQSGRRRR